MRDGTVRRLSLVHKWLFRLTGGVLGRRLVANDMLLLTTHGRQTGDPHTVPLLYLEESGDLVVIASYGGRDHNPDWYENLLEHPFAHVELAGERFDARARTATEAERRDLWPRVKAAYRGYEAYQARTDRTIPLVILERADWHDGSLDDLA